MLASLHYRAACSRLLFFFMVSERMVLAQVVVRVARRRQLGRVNQRRLGHIFDWVSHHGLASLTLVIGVVLVRHASDILLLNHCWLEFVEVFVALLRNHWPLHEL